MNFYKRHLGDYAKDTRHLSMMEHGAYTLLLDYVYATESPLPDDFAVACRICSAGSKAEKAAVASVLNQYFPIGDDGLRHNKRADREIDENADMDVDRERKREHERERQKRLRERRSAMFDALREAGVTPEWNVSMTDLQRMFNALRERDGNAPVTRDHTATRLQTPDSRELPPTPFADATGDSPPNGHDSIELVGKAKREKRPVKRPMPEGWAPSESTLAWVNRFLAEHGLSEDWAQRQHELFATKAKARGWVYADWDRAYEGFFRENGPGGRYAA